MEAVVDYVVSLAILDLLVVLQQIGSKGPVLLPAVQSKPGMHRGTKVSTC